MGCGVQFTLTKHTPGVPELSWRNQRVQPRRHDVEGDLNNSMPCKRQNQTTSTRRPYLDLNAGSPPSMIKQMSFLISVS